MVAAIADAVARGSDSDNSYELSDLMPPADVAVPLRWPRSMSILLETHGSETLVVPSTSRARCTFCSAELETNVAEWCRCVGKQISPICPSCRNCLCTTPVSSDPTLWRATPDWLLKSRAAEMRRRTAEPVTVAVEYADVLIVDDDEEIRLLAAYCVQQMGYRVAVAASGREVLDAVAAQAPRVIITDALMPKMDGRELCREVKTLHPEVKVIVMTSLYTSPRYKYEAYRKFMADEYLAKPIDFERLRDVLEKFAPLNASRV